ncbi:MAG TPA: NAD+ kinase [Clostridiales bacterium]|nr:NAD+ kinase [Clostridiales bacterium]HBR08346.1 NAD+ kinase [Clostridiales bacterium]
MGGKIILCPNPHRDIGLELAKRTMAMLTGDGINAVMSPVFAEGREAEGTTPFEESADGAAMIIAFGGDGTLLQVARMIRGREIPLLGVNLGSKGFMASLEPEDIGLVRRAAAGDFRKSRRMMLDVALSKNGEVIRTDCALNEAVIKSDISCIGLSVASDGVGISDFSGDGVIVATPTGSTAYSLSAGGPIVEPEAENIVVTPICAHGMGARPFVLSPGRTVTVALNRLWGRRALLAVDGSEAVDLEDQNVISIKRSKNCVVIAEMGVKSFYDTAREKLAETM